MVVHCQFCRHLFPRHHGPVFNLPPGVTAYGDGIIDNHYFNPYAVPLPGTLPLLGSGLLGLAGFRLRRKK